jgi:hypothetical protein
MAAIVFQSKFPRDVLQGKHDFDAHTFRVGLSNTAIAGTVEDVTGVTAIATGSGWTGPFTTAATLSDGTGTAAVAFADSSTITAAGGSIGPFRYAYLYNDTASPKALIGTVDFGAATTVTDGNSVVIDFSGNAITINNV